MNSTANSKSSKSQSNMNSKNLKIDQLEKDIRNLYIDQCLNQVETQMAYNKMEVTPGNSPTREIWKRRFEMHLREDQKIRDLIEEKHKLKYSIINSQNETGDE